MKTFEQVSEKAVQIADNDPTARVAVFDAHIRQKIAAWDDCTGDGSFKLHPMQYISKNGGKVSFFDARWDTWETVAGSMFTHVFCSEFVGEQDKKLIASRLRYAQKPLPEPAGFYDFNGIVTRTEVW